MNKEIIARIRAFNRFYTTVIGLLNKTYLDSEFSLTEVRIMYELYHHPDGMTASDLTGLLQVDKGYLSRVLQLFEKKQLVEKEKSAEDGRAFLLRLSRKGQNIFVGLDEASQRQVVTMLNHLSKNETMKLTRHMEAIREILEKTTEKD